MLLLTLVIAMVPSLGQGALLAKCESKSAFRLLPIHLLDFNLLVFTFEGAFYYDKALPVGCFVSCSAFEHFGTFLEWCLRTPSGH